MFQAVRNKVAVSDAVDLPKDPESTTNFMSGVIQSRGETVLGQFKIGVPVYFDAGYADQIDVDGVTLQVIDDEDVLGIVVGS